MKIGKATQTLKYDYRKHLQYEKVITPIAFIFLRAIAKMLGKVKSCKIASVIKIRL